MNELGIEPFWIILLAVVIGFSIIMSIVILFMLIFRSSYLVEGKKIRRAVVLKEKPGTYFIATFDGVENVDKTAVFKTRKEAEMFIIERDEQNKED